MGGPRAGPGEPASCSNALYERHNCTARGTFPTDSHMVAIGSQALNPDHPESKCSAVQSGAAAPAGCCCHSGGSRGDGHCWRLLAKLCKMLLPGGPHSSRAGEQAWAGTTAELEALQGVLPRCTVPLPIACLMPRRSWTFSGQQASAAGGRLPDQPVVGTNCPTAPLASAETKIKSSLPQSNRRSAQQTPAPYNLLAWPPTARPPPKCCRPTLAAAAEPGTFAWGRTAGWYCRTAATICSAVPPRLVAIPSRGS